MSGFVAAVRTEMLKARRSRVPWGVAIGFSLAPLVMGLFMVILKDPERARTLGLLGAKAQLTARTADWPTYLNLLGQAVAVGGAVLFAFLTAWVVGREFADKTVRGLLANPTWPEHDRPCEVSGGGDLGCRDHGLGPLTRPRDRWPS